MMKGYKIILLTHEYWMFLLYYDSVEHITIRMKVT